MSVNPVSTVFTRARCCAARAADLPTQRTDRMDRESVRHRALADSNAPTAASGKARQPDGIHWTYAGAREPAELIAAALQADYGRVL